MIGHQCPADGCEEQVPAHMLMCRTHWYMVPRHLRSAVWNAWDGGMGAGTDEHWAACDAAINAVNRRLHQERATP